MKTRKRRKRDHPAERDFFYIAIQCLETRWFIEYAQAHPFDPKDRTKSAIICGAFLYVLQRAERLLERPLTTMEKAETWDVCQHALEKNPRS